MTDLWVFGYASLMWRPGFPFVEKHRAMLFGYHRALCIRSWEHRGTRKRPGLVMGLDRGGACVGIAFRVAAKDRDATLAYLRERELITKVYREHTGRIMLPGNKRIDAVTYVADRTHIQYAGKLDVAHAVDQVCGAVGGAGPNEEYVLNTAEHIRDLGIRDHWLEEVERHVRARMSAK
ncbi:MAG: gamma-glutamylcyclotransferase [Pseudomonadota bacterium]